jgi:hypothetical protein
MYFSNKLSLLFVACPKTGSTSIESYLMDIDPEGQKFRIHINDLKISAEDVYSGVIGHARAWELKEALGDDIYNKLDVFGMVRHPFDKLISSYFYSKSKKISEAFKFKGKKNIFKRKLTGVLTFLAPKILPISIWAILFPMKTSRAYFFDKNGKRIVTYLGRTDKLSQDVNLILKQFGVETNSKMPHINQSRHQHRDYYFKDNFIGKYLLKKYQEDILLYQLVEKEMNELKMKNQNLR